MVIIGKALAASKKLPPFQPPQDLDVESLEVLNSHFDLPHSLILIFDFSHSSYQAASWAGKTFKAAGKTPKPGEKTPKKTKDDEGLLVREKRVAKHYLLEFFRLRRRRSRRGRRSCRRTTTPMLTQILKDGCLRKRELASSGLKVDCQICQI